MANRKQINYKKLIKAKYKDAILCMLSSSEHTFTSYWIEIDSIQFKSIKYVELSKEKAWENAYKILQQQNLL